MKLFPIPFSIFLHVAMFSLCKVFCLLSNIENEMVKTWSLLSEFASKFDVLSLRFVYEKKKKTHKFCFGFSISFHF